MTLCHILPMADKVDKNQDFGEDSLIFSEMGILWKKYKKVRCYI